MPVRSRPKSIYYVRLKVENARCFAETQELRLVDSMVRSSPLDATGGRKRCRQDNPPAMPVVDAPDAAVRNW